MNHIRKNNIKFYEQYYERSQFSFEEYLLAKNMIKMIGNLGSSNDILEIGYGSCLLLEMMNLRFNLNYYGYEISPSAKKRFKKFSNTVDVDNLENLNKFFDIIILSNVIEHIECDLILLDHLYSKLKKGGSIFLTFPTDKLNDYDPRHFRTYNLDSFKEKIISRYPGSSIQSQYLPPTIFLIIIRLIIIKIGIFLSYLVTNNNNVIKGDNSESHSFIIRFLYLRVCVPFLKLIYNFDFNIAKLMQTSQGFIKITK
jgi:SAM-dependent methyltransferase